MKKVRNGHFLYLRGKNYYFRKRIFCRLLDGFGVKEIKVSLRTGDRAIATKRCLQISLELVRLEEWAKKEMDANAEARERISREYFRRCLDQCRAVVPDVIDADPVVLGSELESWENEHNSLLRSRATGEVAPPPDYGILKKLQEDGARFSEKNDRDLFLNADIEISRIMVAMYQGDFASAVPSETLFPGALLPGKVDSSPMVSSASVSEIVRKYISYKSKSTWCDKTRVDQVRVLGWLMEHTGPDLPLTGLEMATIRSFRDGLLDMPKNAAKHSELTGLGFFRLGAVDKKWPRISVRTAKKYFEMTTGFLEWCVEEGYLETSPARKLRIKHSFNPQEARFPFSPDQLEKLFTSPLFTGCVSQRYRARKGGEVFRDGWFWVPLVGLYSGMRLGEIIDLDLADIQEIDGILTFSVGGTEGEKRLKTRNAKRLIPVHRDLIGLGFGKFLDEARARDRDGRVFAKLTISKTGYSSHNYSKWFGRYLINIGLKTPKTSFHSLRHNFKDGLRQAGVPEGVQNRLMGHSDNGVASTYGSGWSLDILEREINRISFARFLDHLKEKPGINQDSKREKNHVME